MKTPALSLRLSLSAQGSFSELAGFLVHCINMAIMLTFPAAVVLLVPSVTPGKMCFYCYENTICASLLLPTVHNRDKQLTKIVASIMQPNHYPFFGSLQCSHVYKTECNCNKD